MMEKQYDVIGVENLIMDFAECGFGHCSFGPAGF